MPTQKKIFEHWVEKIDIAPNECFACGKKTKLSRCHIIPSWKELNNSVENIHLLCDGCHSESEGLKVYDTWFKSMRKNYWKPPAQHTTIFFEKCGIYSHHIEQMAKIYGNPEDMLEALKNHIHWW
jgi:hypothetical protein